LKKHLSRPLIIIIIIDHTRLLACTQTGCVASCPPGFAPSNFVCKASPATTTPAPSPTGKPNGVLLQIRLLADVATVGAVGFKQMLRESVARSLGIEATRVAINAVISASSTTPSGTKGGTALIELGGAFSDSGSASDGDSDSDSGSVSGIAGGTFLIELQAGAGTGTGASSQVAIVIIDSPTDKTRTSLQLAQTLAAFAASASSTFATDMVSGTLPVMLLGERAGLGWAWLGWLTGWAGWSNESCIAPNSGEYFNNIPFSPRTQKLRAPGRAWAIHVPCVSRTIVKTRLLNPTPCFFHPHQIDHHPCVRIRPSRAATGVRVDSQFSPPTPQVVAACYDGTYSTQARVRSQNADENSRDTDIYKPSKQQRVICNHFTGNMKKISPGRVSATFFIMFREHCLGQNTDTVSIT
jgi:hypothetical protein